MHWKRIIQKSIPVYFKTLYWTISPAHYSLETLAIETLVIWYTLIALGNWGALCSWSVPSRNLGEVTQRQLMVILPILYCELDTYPNFFTRFDKPALPSLSKHWLPPFHNKISPYGVDVMRKLESVSKNVDECLLDKCL